MASTYTSNLNLEKQAVGDNVDTWGDPHLNNNVINPLDTTLGATTSISLSSSNVTLTLSQWQSVCFKLTGTLTNNVNLIFPLSPNDPGTSTLAVGGRRLIDNQTTGNYTVTVKTAASGSTGVAAPQGYRSEVYSDTANVVFSENSEPQAVIQNGVESLSISTSQNDYAIAATTAYARLNVSSAANLTGISGGVAGRVLTLHNIGTAILTLIPSNTSSLAANRMSFPFPVRLTPGMALPLQYDGTTAVWRPTGALPSQGSTGTYQGLTISNNTTTPNSILDVAATMVVVTDTNYNTFTLNSLSVSPNVTSAGINGLDTGAVAANTWYYVWVVFNPTAALSATNPGCVFSTSSSSPTMPSGYTFKKCLGANRTDGSSNFYRVRQQNNRADYVVTAGTNTAAVRIIDSGSKGNATTPTWVAASISNFVPPTATHIHVGLFTSSSSIACVSPNSAYGGFNNSTNPAYFTNFAGGSAMRISDILPIESTNLYWASGGANGTLTCSGWIDNI